MILTKVEVSKHLSSQPLPNSCMKIIWERGVLKHCHSHASTKIGLIWSLWKFSSYCQLPLGVALSDPRASKIIVLRALTWGLLGSHSVGRAAVGITLIVLQPLCQPLVGWKVHKLVVDLTLSLPGHKGFAICPLSHLQNVIHLCQTFIKLFDEICPLFILLEQSTAWILGRILWKSKVDYCWWWSILHVWCSHLHLYHLDQGPQAIAAIVLPLKVSVSYFFCWQLGHQYE